MFWGGVAYMTWLGRLKHRRLVRTLEGIKTSLRTKDISAIAAMLEAFPPAAAPAKTSADTTP